MRYPSIPARIFWFALLLAGMFLCLLRMEKPSRMRTLISSAEDTISIDDRDGVGIVVHTTGAGVRLVQLPDGSYLASAL